MTIISHASSDYDTGILPIRVLSNNIIHGFENIHPTFKSDAKFVHTNMSLNNGIIYSINEKGIYSDKVYLPHLSFMNGNLKEIVLYETFSAYLWIVCYSIYILWNEIAHVPALTKSYMNINLNIMQKALDFLGFGMTLITSYSLWDKDKMPNPEVYHIENEVNIGIANHCYVNAMVFILLHEFYHAKLGHAPTLNVNNTKNNEYEADNKAFDTIIIGMDNDIKKLNYSLGVISGLIALLFLSKNAFSLTHPASDERIKIFIEKLKLNDDHNEIWALPCIAYKLWDIYYNIGFEWGDNSGTYKELFLKIYNQ